MIEPFTWLSVAATAWLFKPVRFRFLIRHAIQTHLPPPNHCRWYPSPRGDFVDVQLFVLPLWHLYLYPWALDPVVLCPLDVLLLLLSEQPQSPCGPEQNRSRKQIFAFGHFASIFEILPPLRSECGGALYLANYVSLGSQFFKISSR